MAYNVELSAEVDRELGKLDAQQAKRILKFLHDRVAKLDDPRSIGEALHGSRLGEFWKYRVGDYRLICKIEDDRLVVLVLRVGHKKEIYRQCAGLIERRRGIEERFLDCAGRRVRRSERGRKNVGLLRPE